MNAVNYNAYLREKFEKDGGIEVLLRYILSETIPPIADFYNAIKIIRENKKIYKNSTLLIIGSHLISEWTVDDNDLLDDLNKMRDELSEKELAIMHYLNANHIFSRSADCTNNPEYQENLMHSLKYRGPFVNNRLLLSNHYRSKAPFNVQLFKEAIENIVHVSYQEDLKKMTTEAFAEPEAYINEFILGIEQSYVNYESLLEKVGLPIVRHKSQ